VGREAELAEKKIVGGVKRKTGRGVSKNEITGNGLRGGLIKVQQYFSMREVGGEQKEGNLSIQCRRLNAMEGKDGRNFFGTGNGAAQRTEKTIGRFFEKTPSRKGASMQLGRHGV